MPKLYKGRLTWYPRHMCPHRSNTEAEKIISVRNDVIPNSYRITTNGYLGMKPMIETRFRLVYLRLATENLGLNQGRREEELVL